MPPSANYSEMLYGIAWREMNDVEMFYSIAWREMNDVDEKNWQSCVARDE